MQSEPLNSNSNYSIRKIINASAFIGYPSEYPANDYSRFITQIGVIPIIDSTCKGNDNYASHTCLDTLYFLDETNPNDVPAIKALDNALTICGLAKLDDFSIEVNFTSEGISDDVLKQVSFNDLYDYDKNINQYCVKVRRYLNGEEVYGIIEPYIKFGESSELLENYPLNTYDFEKITVGFYDVVMDIELIYHKYSLKYTNNKPELKFNNEYVSNVTKTLISSAQGINRYKYEFELRVPKTLNTREQILDVELLDEIVTPTNE